MRGRRSSAAHGSWPRPLWLVATVLRTFAVMAALTVIAARIGTRQSVATVLPSEAT